MTTKYMKSGAIVESVAGETVSRQFSTQAVTMPAPPMAGDEPKEAVRKQIEFQRSIMDVVRVMASIPFLSNGGRLHRKVSFTLGSDLVLKHRLGRAFQGAFPLTKYSAGDFIVTDNPAPVAQLNEGQVTLRPDATFICDVWVY
jgi:hypothetical protein